MNPLLTLLSQASEEKKESINEIMKVGLPVSKAKLIKGLLQSNMMYLHNVYLTKGRIIIGNETKENFLNIKRNGNEMVVLFVTLRATFKKPNLLPLFTKLKLATDYFYIADQDFNNPTIAFITFIKRKTLKPKRR